MSNTITYREVIEAVRKNGYPRITGATADFDDDGNLIGACALGQASMNLGYQHWQLWDMLRNASQEGHLFTRQIYMVNDMYPEMPLNEIADIIEGKFITRLNDKLIMDEPGEEQL